MPNLELSSFGLPLNPWPEGTETADYAAENYRGFASACDAILTKAKEDRDKINADQNLSDRGRIHSLQELANKRMAQLVELFEKRKKYYDQQIDAARADVGGKDIDAKDIADLNGSPFFQFNQALRVDHYRKRLTDALADPLSLQGELQVLASTGSEDAKLALYALTQLPVSDLEHVHELIDYPDLLSRYRRATSPQQFAALEIREAVLYQFEATSKTAGEHLIQMFGPDAVQIRDPRLGEIATVEHRGKTRAEG